MSDTVINTNPTFGAIGFSQWHDNDSYVEKQSAEKTEIDVGKYASGISMNVRTTYLYDSGHSSTHHTHVEFSADQCRQIAVALNKIADEMD